MVGKPIERIDRHKDGSITAKGHIDALTGYWEWFRKDDTKMRSGYFENGKQAGEWTTYDARGKRSKSRGGNLPVKQPLPSRQKRKPRRGMGGALSK
jgi:hypothetical protein